MGGDQIYPGEPEDADLLEETLFDAFFDRYVSVLGQPGLSALLGSVPTLTMWDDHDICDGWGSLSPDLLESTAGQRLFSAARRAFLIFQKGVKDDGALALASDPAVQFGFSARLPGVSLVVPDLRSERQPERVMGPSGWASTERMLADAEEERLFLLSTVPLLGPRLSLVETAMNLLPGAQYYEDDLRDQWQSRYHREEWRRMLKLLIGWQDRTGGTVTALSGEIHGGADCRIGFTPRDHGDERDAAEATRLLRDHSPATAESLGQGPRPAVATGRFPRARPPDPRPAGSGPSPICRGKELPHDPPDRRRLDGDLAPRNLRSYGSPCDLTAANRRRCGGAAPGERRPTGPRCPLFRRISAL